MIGIIHGQYAGFMVGFENESVRSQRFALAADRCAQWFAHSLSLLVLSKSSLFALFPMNDV